MSCDEPPDSPIFGSLMGVSLPSPSVCDEDIPESFGGRGTDDFSGETLGLEALLAVVAWEAVMTRRRTVDGVFCTSCERCF